VREVTIPALGMAMTEALLAVWLKQPGDIVRAGEPIAEIETDKATMELESPADGVLGAHLFAAGSMVPIAEPVCRILDADGAEVAEGEQSTADPAAGAPASVGSPVAVPAFAGIFDELRQPAQEELRQPTQPDVGLAAAPVSDDPTLARRTPHAESPRQRRLARLAADNNATSEPTLSSRRRDAIAARVTESWRTIPHFAVSRDMDASGVLEALRELRRDVPTATVTDMLLHAGAATLAAFPASTSGDVGLAVATPDGVMMPVIVDASGLAAADLVSARQAAVRRAREGRLAEVDMAIQPFGSLSNLGGLDVDSFTGIIPLGQQCLMTVGRIAPRLVASPGGFSFRDTISVTLNVDHRTIDGDVAARALSVFAQALASLRSWVKGETV
jgi:pyruvate dehydrogenase E2 component (dihydrolipoamide acetyltransferase)